MVISLKNKTALVTGAGKGIGRHICLSLAKAGACVWGCSRTESDLNSLKKSLDRFQKGNGVLPIDLMKDGGILELITTMKKISLQPDIVIHNLGGSLQIRDTFADSNDFQKVWKYNVGIGIDLNRYLIKNMKKKRWGRIIHLSTLSTTTYSGNLAYLSAKCGLNGYVKGMSRELAAKNIVMCAVAPGLVELEGRYFTELQKNDPSAISSYFDEHLPLHRMIQPNEVAAVVTMLCTAIADTMSGAIIPVDGGGH